MFGIASSAHAIPITLEFTVTDIPPTGSDQLPPPVDTVSGVIVYEAAALGATIDSLISISLDIGNDSHTLAETSFVSPFGVGTLDLIGGLNATSAVSPHTEDFYLIFDRVAGTGLEFIFAVSDTSGVWGATNFSHFSLSAPALIAEPPVLSLLMLGLLGALGMRRRRLAVIR